MPSQTEFFEHTSTLALPVTNVGTMAVGVGVGFAPVFFCVEVKPLAQSGKTASVDIDDLVAEFQQGRQWVAETFYQDRPHLAQLRLSKGWSQLELAQRASTSQSYVARLERGKIDPQISTVRKIAEALGVSMETLAHALLVEAQS